MLRALLPVSVVLLCSLTSIAVGCGDPDAVDDGVVVGEPFEDEGGDVGSTGDEPDATDDPLVALSDEFDDPETLANWQLASEADGTPLAHQYLEIASGTLGLEPTSTAWYGDYRGPLLFKLVEGDFVVEIDVSAVSPSDLSTPPSLPFNAAGLLVHNPGSGPGHENWLAYNVGRQLSSIAVEGKNTVESESVLTLVDDLHYGRLRVCRVGNVFILAKQFDGDDAWVEQHVFVRNDFAPEVRVGLIANGWNSVVEQPDPSIASDVRGVFEYVHFWTPESEADCLE